jgi:membrane protein implicated in regulation of membrane protease activity
MRRSKLFFAVLGFVLAAVGMAMEHRLIVYAAMVSLAVALALRLIVQRREREERDRS